MTLSRRRFLGGAVATAVALPIVAKLPAVLLSEAPVTASMATSEGGLYMTGVSVGSKGTYYVTPLKIKKMLEDLIMHEQMHAETYREFIKQQIKGGSNEN